MCIDFNNSVLKCESASVSVGEKKIKICQINSLRVYKHKQKQKLTYGIYICMHIYHTYTYVPYNRNK